MREYVCDFCSLIMCERYPSPGDERKDFCCEDCFDQYYREYPEEAETGQ